MSLRPIFHQKDSRTEAHIFLGVLVYDLVSTIRHQLKAKGIRHDWSNIIRIMNTQKLVTTSMKNKEAEVIMLKKFSRPSREVAEIYQAMNYRTQPFTIKKFVFPQ